MESARTPKNLNKKLYRSATSAKGKYPVRRRKKVPAEQGLIVIRAGKALITLTHRHALEKWLVKEPGLVVVSDTLKA